MAMATPAASRESKCSGNGPGGGGSSSLAAAAAREGDIGEHMGDVLAYSVGLQRWRGELFSVPPPPGYDTWPDPKMRVAVHPERKT